MSVSSLLAQRRKWRTPVLGATLLFVVSVSAACGAAASTSSRTQSSGPVKLGIVWPFSGADSNYGPDGLAGAKLALQQAGYKVDGKKIELIKANEDVLNPANTLTQVQQLVQQDGVHIILGPVFGSSQQAVAPYLRANNVMSFVPYGATKELGGTGNTISWPSLDTSFAAPLGGYLANTLHYKSIDVVTADYVYGQDLMQGVTSTFKQAGGSVVQQQAVPLSATDILPYATNLNRKADALVMWLVPQTEATFVQDFRNLGIKMPIIFVNGMFDPTFQSAGPLISGSYGIVDWSLALKNPTNVSFVSAFEAANHGQAPDNSNAAAYVDTELALAAIKAAHGSTNFAKLKQAILNVHMDTPYGPASIDKNFFGVTDRTIVKAEKVGNRWEWVPVKTFTSVPNGS